MEIQYFRLDDLLGLMTSAFKFFAARRTGGPPNKRRRNVPAAAPWLAVGVLVIGIASIPIRIFGLTLLNVFSPFTGIHWTYVETGRGEQRRIPLNDAASSYGDDSTAQLNTDSRILLTSTPTERHVTILKGEARFKVAPDEQRPFVVTSPSLDVRAVGTEFNVRVDDDARTDVAVFEGVVQVETRPREVGMAAALRHFLTGRPPAWTHSVRLERNNVLSVTPQGKILPTEQTPTIEEVQQWSEYRISFRDAPISRIAAEFNRYLPYLQLEVADAGLSECRMAIYPPMKATDVGLFVRALELSAGAELTIGKDGSWVLGRSEARGGGTARVCPGK